MTAGARRRPSSLVLYGGAGTITTEVENRFFGKLRMPNGTWKTTYPRRLDDLNDLLLPLIPAGRRVRLLDVAVSSGVATLEWSDQLTAAGVDHAIVAGDISTEGWLTSAGTSAAVVFDESGRTPLLLEVGPISLPVQSQRRVVRLARPVLAPLLRGLARLAAAQGVAEPMAPARRGRLVHRPIPLVTPALAARPQIDVVTDDVSVARGGGEEFDAIRVANLLHRAYFDDGALRSMVRNLVARLRDGGLLAVCRTDAAGTNDATIFRLESGRLTAVATLGAGAEIAGLITSAAPVAGSR